jgi:toxin-antitoxin system PIN domain toxin
VSYSLDADVLLYATDESSPRCAAAKRFLLERAADPDLCCLAWITLLSYLRLATHPLITPAPLTPAQALANVASLLRLPRVVTVSEGDGFLNAYRDVTRDLHVRGNLVPDAHLATILRQHNVRTLYTADAGFRRFPFLDVRDPFAGA